MMYIVFCFAEFNTSRKFYDRRLIRVVPRRLKIPEALLFVQYAKHWVMTRYRYAYGLDDVIR